MSSTPSPPSSPSGSGSANAPAGTTSATATGVKVAGGAGLDDIVGDNNTSLSPPLPPVPPPVLCELAVV